MERSSGSRRQPGDPFQLIVFPVPGGPSQAAFTLSSPIAIICSSKDGTKDNRLPDVPGQLIFAPLRAGAGHAGTSPRPSGTSTSLRATSMFIFHLQQADKFHAAFQQPAPSRRCCHCRPSRWRLRQHRPRCHHEQATIDSPRRTSEDEEHQNKVFTTNSAACCTCRRIAESKHG